MQQWVVKRSGAGRIVEKRRPDAFYTAAKLSLQSTVMATNKMHIIIGPASFTFLAVIVNKNSNEGIDSVTTSPHFESLIVNDGYGSVSNSRLVIITPPEIGKGNGDASRTCAQNNSPGAAPGRGRV